MVPLCLRWHRVFSYRETLPSKSGGESIMSEASIAKKAAIVEEVTEKFNAAASVVIVDYRGLTVDEVTRLRKQLREANVEMKVIKNSILSRAAKAAGLEG